MTAFESKGDPYHRKLYEDAEAEARAAEKTAREADAAALIAERNVKDKLEQAGCLFLVAAFVLFGYAFYMGIASNRW
jgi:hypothetical protein